MIFKNKEALFDSPPKNELRYKLYKKWLIGGISILAISLGIGLPTRLVNADETSEMGLLPQNNLLAAPQTQKVVKKRITSNFSTAPSFAQTYSRPLKSGEAAAKPVYGEIMTGKDTILRYFYGMGDNTSLALVGESDATHTPRGGVRGFYVSLMGALPNFNVINTKTNEVVSDALFNHGSWRGRINIGINNDMSTLTTPVRGSQKLWYVGVEDTPGLANDPNNKKLNKTLISKYSSDYLINGKTYTIDYTQTFKPNGSYVNYTIQARNVTGLNSTVSGDPTNNMNGLFFESDFDTLFNDENAPKADDAPMYYLANNAGLYHRGHGYNLNYYFTTKSSPTGWASPWDAYISARTVFKTPDSLGNKVPQGSPHHKAGELATDLQPNPNVRNDPGLFMIWKSQDLAQGESRELSYQTGLVNENAVFAKIKLDREFANYTGGEFTVSGTVSDEDTTALPLKYYYAIDGGKPEEFIGPVLTDNSPQRFSFKIPANVMSLGDPHQIGVYTVDRYGQVSPTTFMALTSYAEIKTKNLDLFVGDKFNKFDGLDAGGVKVDGSPITSSDIDIVEITDNNKNQVNEDVLTSKAGKYTITYTYLYGQKPERAVGTSTVNVYTADDVNRGADFYLADKTYYVGEDFQLSDIFQHGRKNGQEPMTLNDLTHVIKNKATGSLITSDQEVTTAAGSYEISFSYSYGNNNQAITKTSNVKVIDPKTATFNYLDENYKPIDDQILATITDPDLKKGVHRSSYGSNVPLHPLPELLLNGKKYFEFLRVENRNHEVLPSPYAVLYGDVDQEINLIYKGVPISNAVTIHYYLRDRNGTNTTKTVKPDLPISANVGDIIEAKINDKNQIAPPGYALASDQRDQSWTVTPEQTGTIIFYYTAEQQDNITVNFVDADTGKVVDSDKPTGHYTGDELNLGKDGEGVKKLPKGYHYAKAKELEGKKDSKGKPLAQPDNATYTPIAQTKEVYVVGDDIADNATNAVTVNHYLKDSETTVPGMQTIHKGGRVGQKLEFKLTDPEQTPPAGYSLVEGQTNQSWTLKATEGKTLNFYYTADPQDNITVNFVDADTGEVVDSDKPTGHYTGDKLNLGKDGEGVKKLPKGYHYAKAKELEGKVDSKGDPLVQPDNATYTPIAQTKDVYVVADDIADNATNAVTVHHYLKDSETTVPGMKTIHKGGRVGQTLEFKLTDPEQTPPAGYSLVEGQTNQSWTLKATEGKVLNFYYTAEQQDNITVNFVNIDTGEVVGTDKPTGHYTGDELDLGKNGEGVKKLPAGFHYATEKELWGKKDSKGNSLVQPKNPTYTPIAQTKEVYVVGEEIAADATNAVTVNHYLKDSETTVPGMKTIHKGGRVGQKLEFKLTDPEQTPPAGYSLVEGQANQSWTLKATEGKTLNFYYTADTQDNIKVSLININNGKLVDEFRPEGHHTGDELDLSETGLSGKIPAGYHFAKEDELKGNKQPKNPIYTLQPQNPRVYVVGDPVDEETNAESLIIIHHYLEGSTTNVPGMSDTKKGGRIGDIITVRPTDPAQAAPAGYTIIPGQATETWTLTHGQSKEITYYYKANERSNITVQFIDTANGRIVSNYQPTGKHIGDYLTIPDELKIPEGYHYASESELTGTQKQPENQQYELAPKVVNVYIAKSKAGEDSKIKVEIINIYNLKDKIHATPNADAGEKIEGDHLEKTIKPTGQNIGDELDLHTIVPEGYHYATPSELKPYDLKQEQARFGSGEVKVKLYVVGEWYSATHHNSLRIQYKKLSAGKLSGMREMVTIKKAVRVGDEFILNPLENRTPRNMSLIGGIGSTNLANYPNVSNEELQKIKANLKSGLIKGTFEFGKPYYLIYQQR